MRISVTRDGGFAGMVRTTVADSDSLEPGVAGDLAARVEQVRLFEMPDQLGPTTRQPDRFNYTVVVEEEGRRHQVSCSEESMPDELRSLIAWLDSVPGAERKTGPPGAG